MRKREVRALERRVRDERPTPTTQLIARFAPARRTHPRRQLALAGGLTAVLLVAMSAVGGISYAANSVADAAHVAKSIVAPAKGHGAVVSRATSAGGDQYKPGYSCGDESHSHTGPPGLTNEGGAFAPPLKAQTKDTFAKVVGTSFTIDEQAHLYVSVIDSSGTELLLTQKSKRGGSSLGQGLDGPQTKVIQYLVLVPRAIPLQLRIPDNLLTPGRTYSIRIIAVDPQGNKSVTYVRFRA